MTDANALFAAADVDIFDALAQDETVQRGTDTPVPVRVVVAKGVKRYGDLGQVIGRVTTVDFLASQWQPEVGDVLTLDTGTKKVAAIEDDDGFVVKVVLHG